VEDDCNSMPGDDAAADGASLDTCAAAWPQAAVKAKVAKDEERHRSRATARKVPPRHERQAGVRSNKAGNVGREMPR
jgi:hypothetical protein